MVSLNYDLICMVFTSPQHCMLSSQNINRELALVHRFIWLHFCIVGGSGDLLSSYTVLLMWCFSIQPSAEFKYRKESVFRIYC